VKTRLSYVEKEETFIRKSTRLLSMLHFLPSRSIPAPAYLNETGMFSTSKIQALQRKN
jgi:hypothetical protein